MFRLTRPFFFLLFYLLLVSHGCLLAQEQQQQKCNVDLTNPGIMKDIASNALIRGLNQQEADVSIFLKGAETRYATGQELLKAAALHFMVKEAELKAEVQKYKHCNCNHSPLAHIKLSPFALDVTLHVILHELGHALIREFDLPILGNEESMADAFATYYLTTYLPDRALDVLKARTQSLMFEANQVPREKWEVKGEHNNDARRAHQIVALAIAADPKKYNPLAKVLGMSKQDIKKCVDYGAEILRSWRRVLKPLLMPDGMCSRETAIKGEPNDPLAPQIVKSSLLGEINSAMVRFDWHSHVKLHFALGDGQTGWSRSKRTITIYSEYIRRFIKQGEKIK